MSISNFLMRLITLLCFQLVEWVTFCLMSASSFWVLFCSRMFSSRACSTAGSSSLCTRHTGTVWSHLGDLLFLPVLLRLIVLHLVQNMRRRVGEHSLTSHTLHKRGRICNYWVVIKKHIHCSVYDADICLSMSWIYHSVVMVHHSATMTTQCTPWVSYYIVLQCIQW